MREYGGDVVKIFWWCWFCGGLEAGVGLTQIFSGPIFDRLIDAGGQSWVRIHFTLTDLKIPKLTSRHPRQLA